MLTISNAVPNPDNQSALFENNLVPQILQLLTFYSENEDIAKYVIISSIRLSTNDTVSMVIAEEGMRSFMKACTGFVETDNAALLSLLFELLGQLAFLKTLVGVVLRQPGAFVPHHHGSSTVVLGGDRPLECAVVQRVIFSPHSKAFFARIVAEAPRHVPAQQHTFPLQPEIIMQPCLWVVE